MPKFKRKSGMKKYDYNKNRKKAWKKSKKMPSIRCKEIKKAWDEKKSTKQNMKEMGLSYNPNTTFPVPKTKNVMDKLVMEEADAEMIESTEPQKTNVVKELEAEANAPQPKRLRLSQPEIIYCTYMMDKYGDNYKGMARDERNYYQDTPKQIRKKILTFKGIPQQYNVYLKSKQKNAMDMS